MLQLYSDLVKNKIMLFADDLKLIGNAANHSSKVKLIKVKFMT